MEFDAQKGHTFVSTSSRTLKHSLAPFKRASCRNSKYAGGSASSRIHEELSVRYACLGFSHEGTWYRWSRIYRATFLEASVASSVLLAGLKLSPRNVTLCTT